MLTVSPTATNVQPASAQEGHLSALLFCSETAIETVGLDVRCNLCGHEVIDCLPSPGSLADVGGADVLQGNPEDVSTQGLQPFGQLVPLKCVTRSAHDEEVRLRHQ